MRDERDGTPAAPAGWGRIEWAQELHARTAAASRRHPGTVASRTRTGGGPELPADRTDRKVA